MSDFGSINGTAIRSTADCYYVPTTTTWSTTACTNLVFSGNDWSYAAPPSHPYPEEKPVPFNAKKFIVMSAKGLNLGTFDALDEAQEAAEQHAETNGERAFVCKAVKVAKPTRRDVKTEDV